MFDWNDEELANIIWGEAGETDDHIVPYPEASDDYCIKKEWKQECDSIKPTEQKSPATKIDLHAGKLESSSNYDTSEGISTTDFGTDRWPDLSLSNVAKTEQHCIAEAIQLDKDGEIFQNSNEGKEQGEGDLVDLGWANIGSFDDLDRIFSNDDSIFGHASLGDADELWTSSRDATDSIKGFPVSSDSPSLTSGALRNASEHVEIKREHAQQDDQSVILGYGKTDYSAPHGLQNAHAILDHVEYVGGESKPMEKEQTDLDMGKSTLTNSYLIAENSSTPNEQADKVSRQRKIPRCRKKLEEKCKEKILQDFNGTWSSSRTPTGHFENQSPHFMVQSFPSALSQKRQLQGPESFPFQHVSNQYVAQSMRGNLTTPTCVKPICGPVHVPSHIQTGEFKHQHLFSSHEGSPGNANAINLSADTSAKPVAMTPQEKIEKLRRRQQLQAMLAIQKQQQQFSHHFPSTNQLTTQKCTKKNQIQHFERADQEVEGFSTVPSLDPNSSVDQNDSNMVSVSVDDYSAEDAILYRLQDIISKLDVKIRLCIRDSLFRLAQSAMERHSPSDTNSSNKSSMDEHEVIEEEINSQNRYGRMPDVETVTNPIDRTVAHLLFHRPLDLSEKHLDPPESPVSTKFPREHQTAGSVNLSNEILPDSLKNKQFFPLQGSANRWPLTEPQSVDQLKNSILMDSSKNTSDYGPAHGGTMKVEASL